VVGISAYHFVYYRADLVWLLGPYGGGQESRTPSNRWKEEKEEEEQRRALQEARFADKSGPLLTGWCLARNGSDDLVFLRTKGYHAGSIENFAAPGGARFHSAGFSVKSRDSDDQFMVFVPLPHLTGPSIFDMFKWAKEWTGYQVLGEEKEYYMKLILPQVQLAEANGKSGPLLTGWCLARNESDDLVFLRTKGYHAGSIENYTAPGGARFHSAGISVKSRDSDHQFMVFVPQPNFTGPCTRADMVKWAKEWTGYEVLGDEKKYYMELIKSA